MKLLVTAAAVLMLASTSANAWTDRNGHWQESPQLYGPINPGNVYAPYGMPPGYFYGPPPPPPCCYEGPMVVVPPPTDAQVIAGTIFGIASMFARPHYRGW
jgi:hypothetical protein